MPLSKIESDIKFYEIDLYGNKLTEKLLLDDAQNLFAGKTNLDAVGTVGDMMKPEEIFCAQYIDANPNVETWIKNTERAPEYSF